MLAPSPRRLAPRLAALLVGGVALGGLPAARADEPPGALLPLDHREQAPRLLAAARRAGGARWRLVELPAAEIAGTAPDLPSEEELEALRRAYLEADFLRCLARAQRLDVDALLAAGQRERAAALLVFGAACALGAEEREVARAWAERLLAAELEAEGPLQVTSVDFQRFLDALRPELEGLAEVRLATRPPGALVVVDGGLHSCARTPCRLRLRRGEHLLVASALGHLPRRARVAVASGAEQVVLSLDPAPASEVRRQLGEALRQGRRPDEPRWMAAAADAFGAPVLLVTWRAEGRHHAAVYDASERRRVAHAMVPEAQGPEAAVAAAVDTWRGAVEPRPLWRNPWFWAGTVGAAVLTGVATWLALRPAEKRYDLVVRFR